MSPASSQNCTILTQSLCVTPVSSFSTRVRLGRCLYREHRDSNALLLRCGQRCFLHSFLPSVEESISYMRPQLGLGDLEIRSMLERGHLGLTDETCA